jgi:putative ABC transport system permease protein
LRIRGAAERLRRVLRLIAAELAHRRGRALALLAGIAVATASFTVLTGASESSRLEIRGNVAKHFRSSYDVLVRAPRSVQPLERTEGLVQQNFLSGSFGGITMDQYKKIRDVPGVEVAAPLAVYGYVMPDAEIPIRLGDHLSPGLRSLFRVHQRWTADRGTVRVRDPDSYVYVTRRKLFDPPGHVSGDQVRLRGSEAFDSNLQAGVCPTPSTAKSAYTPAARSWLWCWSTQTGLASGFVNKQVLPDLGARIHFPFPLLVAGIDPEAEARLSGADRAVVSGRYFKAGEGARKLKRYNYRVAPVLAAASTDVDLAVDVTIDKLPDAAAHAFARAKGDRPAARRALEGPPGTPLPIRRTITARDAYALLLGQLRQSSRYVDTRWTAGPPRYTTVGHHHVRAEPVPTDRFTWGAAYSDYGTGTGFVTAPVTGRDESFRRFVEHVVSHSDPPFNPLYQVVGTFDPNKLAGALDRDVAPLNPFHATTPPAVDPGAAAWLRGRDLLPDGNMAGYVSPPPALLTTIGARETWTLPKLYGHETEEQGAAPISVVRVRVRGVKGVDRTSRERIRLVAERIARTTGLQVDVTAGSSSTPVTVDLPAAKLGRPAVSLRESWIKKGVATAILTAVDRKSLVLFLLVLLVCALFCVNATSAAVRSRATELGVLACVGWPARKLFQYLLTEVGLIGAAAGIAGTLVALPVGALLGLPVSGTRALLAIPAATALALLAGAVPAARAARSDPLEAVRPAVRPVRSGRAVRSLRGLAILNLLRVPGRTALGVLSLMVGIFALTVLAAVTAAFKGAVVGTVLGDAVAVQVRTADYVAVGATLVLGGLAVADVLYLNLRDRSAEVATLRATGWNERQLTRLIVLEGAGLGIAGGVAGAGLGLAVAAAFTHELTPSMPFVAIGAAALGVAIATAASFPPAGALRRLPTATLLAEE